jgi:hypothetical protein
METVKKTMIVTEVPLDGGGQRSSETEEEDGGG